MSSPVLNVSPLFACPLVDLIHPEPAALNAELTTLFTARAAEGDRYRNRLMTAGKQGLFESEFDLFKWPEPPVQRLRQFCFDALVRTVAQLSRLPEAKVRAMDLQDDTWFHLTPHGGYTTAHVHPMAAWSGVYCVDPGDDAPAHPDSGVLRFFDPRVGSSMYLDPSNSKLVQPYGFHIINIKFRPGQLVLFPSYLLHEVAPYMGRRPRITVAFNVAFRAGR